MRIEPHYVTFEQAKLLNEKGFNEECDNKYIANCIWQKPNSREKYKNSEIHPNSSDVTAPEQWQVVEWLRVNHGIWVYVVGGGNHQFYPIYQDKSEAKHEIMQFYYTPQEATSAAINYILKELI
jgi:hypothetical protein